MSSAAGPPRVSRFGWSFAGAKGRVGNREAAEAPAVLIATADAELRSRWRGVLHGGFPVRDVSDRDCLERTIATLNPNVLLLDIDLLGVGGIGDGPIIRALARETRVVLLSGCPSEREGIRVLKAGARGLGLPRAQAGQFIGMDLDEPEVDMVALAQAFGVRARRVTGAGPQRSS